MLHLITRASLSFLFCLSPPPTDLQFWAICNTKFLTVLTLVHEDDQFSKYYKNITLSFASWLLLWNWYTKLPDVREIHSILSKTKKKKSGLCEFLNILKSHHLNKYIRCTSTKHKYHRPSRSFLKRHIFPRWKEITT